MLTVYSLENSEKWDSLVREFKDFDSYYLSGYVKGFKIHGDGEPLLFYYCDATIKGINVVMKRDIAKTPFFKGKLPENTYFDFSTPYGYGGWIIEGTDHFDSLFNAYSTWCKRNNIISEFVRFHPITENHKFCEDYYEVVSLGNTVSMDLSSTDAIWDNITSNNRNMIRKAKKNSLTVLNGRSPEIFETFREIYNLTMKKNNAEDYYYFGEDFYKSILEDLPYNAQVFYVIAENGDIAAASIMLTSNGKMSYHLSGSRREYMSLAPTNLLLYEAAVWGSLNGCKTLHLGGGVGSADDGLFVFKKSFYRGDLCTFHIGKKIFIPEFYDMLVEKRDDINNSSYFPKYRA